MNDQLTEKAALLKLTKIQTEVSGLLKEAQDKNLSYAAFTERLFDLELSYRNQRLVKNRFLHSKLAEELTLDRYDFNFHPSRKNNKNKIIELFTLDFIKNHSDVVLVGEPGVGKSYIAKALAYSATQQGMKVLFTSAMDMINNLIFAEENKNLLRKLAYYQNPNLLIIDELGYLPLNEQGSNLLFQVISKRHGVKSTVITTNMVFKKWGNIFCNNTVAKAIADRLIHKSVIVVYDGPSYRDPGGKQN